jgi:hypothetical protein
MNQQDLEKILIYIVEQGLKAIKDNTVGVDAVLDYVAIFSKSENEYQEMLSIAETLGEEVDKETIKTGHTFLLKTPLATPAGLLKLIKIRIPDPTRPQRGDSDFKIQNYQEFKDKYLQSSGNFTLMPRKEYEMIEIKGVDVLVYIPNKTLRERMKKY